MSVRFREAGADDIPAVVALLRDDLLGSAREDADPAVYRTAFEAMRAEPGNSLIVGEDAAGNIVATYQLVFISGLSLGGARRAQIEAVRVAAVERGRGLGRLMLADAEARARAAGCRILQLTANAARTDAHRFYERAGFAASHLGFKRDLDPA